MEGIQLWLIFQNSWLAVAQLIHFGNFPEVILSIYIYEFTVLLPASRPSSQFVFSAVLVSATWPKLLSLGAWEVRSKELEERESADFAVLWSLPTEPSMDFKTSWGLPNWLVLTGFLTALWNTPTWMTRDYENSNSNHENLFL